jgi:hypothetical protein
MSTISKPSAMIGNILDQANLRNPGNITVQPGKAKAIRGRAKRHDDDVDAGRQNFQDDVSVAPADGAVDTTEFQDGMMLAQADTRTIGEGVAVGAVVASDGGAAIAATEVASQGVTGKMIGGGIAAIGGIAAVASGGGGGGSGSGGGTQAPTPTVTTVGRNQVDAAAHAEAAATAFKVAHNIPNDPSDADLHQADVAAFGSDQSAESAHARAAEVKILSTAAHTGRDIASAIEEFIIAAQQSGTPLEDAAAAMAAFVAEHPGDAAAAALVFGFISAIPPGTDVAAAAHIVTGVFTAIDAGLDLKEAAANKADKLHQLDVLADSSTEAHHNPITVEHFDAGPLASGGDIIDMSAIASLTDSVATGLNEQSDFGANNVFIFDGTAVSIDDAASKIAADDSVVATQGYIVIRDSDHADAVTVYHSTNLDENGAETALVLLSGVTITNLTAANFVV